MRQSDSVSEELDTENVQCALDFENTTAEAIDGLPRIRSYSSGCCTGPDHRARKHKSLLLAYSLVPEATHGRDGSGRACGCEAKAARR